MNAAWHNDLHAEVGLHLGELQEAQQHQAQALATYQVAEAATAHTDIRGVGQPPTPLQRDFAARILRLKKDHPEAALKDPADALRDLLKLKAGPSDGQTLVAPYRFLVTANGVQSSVALETVDGDHGTPDPARDLSRLTRAVPENLVPQSSNARLLRSGTLNCHQAVCEVVLSPLGATR